MEIISHSSEIDKFIISLSKQELKNIQDGIKLMDISDSPWTKKTCKQIQQALDDNTNYRKNIW